MNDTTASRGSRMLGIAALCGVTALLLFGLWFSPPEQDQGDAVRLLYVHAPSGTVMLLAFGVTAFGSLLYLWKRSQFWDLVAGASAEIGVLFTAFTLLTGMLWGRPTWGVYWTWDARLTSTALLFLLFLGYLAVRRVPADPDVRARRSAWAALIAFVDVPIVHWSVSWWRSLHQEATLLRLDPQIDGLMLFTLVLGIVVFSVVYLWLLVHRFRVAYLQARLEERSLADALATRRAEGDAPREPELVHP